MKDTSEDLEMFNKITTEAREPSIDDVETIVQRSTPVSTNYTMIFLRYPLYT